MAGDWIKWTKGLARKREVLGIAARMELIPAAAAGLCMVLWEWLDDNVTAAQIDDEGNAVVTLGALQPSFIDAVVGASGFAVAMSAEGWLCLRSGSLTIPNYGRHNGQTAKDRALTAERVGRHRAGKCNGVSVTPVTVAPLPEKRREEENTPPPAGARSDGGDGRESGAPPAAAPRGAAVALPDWFTPELSAAWEDWLAHLAERDARPTRMTLLAWIQDCQRAGVAKSVEVLRFSIGKGAKSPCWDGPFRIGNGNGNGNGHGRAAAPVPVPARKQSSQSPALSALFPDGVPEGLKGKVNTWSDGT